MKLPSTIGLLVAALLPATGLAQDGTRLVEPGAVASVVVEVPSPEGVHPSGQPRFVFEPSSSVRAFGPLTGPLVLPDRGPLRVPIAFWVDHDQPADSLTVGTLEIRWPDGRGSLRDVVVRVAPRRVLEVRAVSEVVEGTPGELIEIPVDLVNRGNLSDTVSVRVELPVEWGPPSTEVRRVVTPGGRVAVPVRLVVPRRARPGEMRRVKIAASGRDTASSDAVEVLVTRPGDVGGFEALPASVFVGSAWGGRGGPGESLVAAVDARGRIGRETEVWFGARDADVVGTAAAFRDLASGPHFHFGLRRPTWETSFGEVAAREEPLVAHQLRGRGGELRLTTGRGRVEGFLARPHHGARRDEEGHLALGSAVLAWHDLELGVVLSDLARPVGTADETASSRSASITVQSEALSDHRFRVQAGVLRVSDVNGRQEFGPAGEIDWIWRDPATTASLQARAVPATAAGTGIRGNAFTVGASRRIVGPLSVTGTVFRNSYPALAPGAGSSHQGASAAVRLSPGEVRIQVGANIRRSWFESSDIASGERRSGWATAHLPLGPARLDVRAEAAVERTGDAERSSSALHVTVPWSDERGWLSLGASAWAGGFDGTRIQARAAGEVDVARLSVGGAVYVRRSRSGVRSEGYGSASLDVTPDLAVVLGVERDDTDRDGWSLSFGVRRRFGMPLPLPRLAAVMGVVFDDLDGDGSRDDGEAGVPGIRVTLGPLEATTDGTGRFRFEEAPLGAGRLRVDVTTLETGAMAPPAVALDDRGRAAIPVVRTGGIEIRAFFDRDGDGTMGASEDGLVGARLDAIDVEQKVWSTTTDESGAARLTALPPGRYVLRVTAGPTMETLEVDHRVEIELGAGDAVFVPIPLLDAEKEVRF